MDKFNDELIEKVATGLNMEVGTVHKIVSFQFKDILRAARNARQMEMTWFGKWYASAGKCRRHIERLRMFEQQIEKRLNSGDEMSELRISSYNTKLRSIREKIDFLRSKMDYEVRLEGANGRDLEQPFCEGEGRDNSEAEAEYLQELPTEFGEQEDGGV